MSNTLVLVGLDGSNPLAFLAALGTLRTMTRAWSNREVKMGWVIQNGIWNPVLNLDKATDESTLTQVLFQHLEREISSHPIAFMESLHGAASGELRLLIAARASSAQSTDRDKLDWLSAMCSELAPEATSQVQTARRDYFWGNLKSVMRLTEQSHLLRTLFAPWDYADPLDNQSLHLEPGEDRRHAHQWHKPSGDPTRKTNGGMLGANRLAIEAFPFFQSIAVKDKLATRGFSGNRSDDTRWTWPIWSCTAGLDVVASLLASPTIQHELLNEKNMHDLRAQGIAAAFRSRRILVGKTPNFTPAMPV